jgi:hypothetical protein
MAVLKPGANLRAALVTLCRNKKSAVLENNCDSVGVQPHVPRVMRRLDLQLAQRDRRFALTCHVACLVNYRWMNNWIVYPTPNLTVGLYRSSNPATNPGKAQRLVASSPTQSFLLACLEADGCDRPLLQREDRRSQRTIVRLRCEVGCVVFP